MIPNSIDNPRSHLNRKIFLYLQKHDLISMLAEERADDTLFSSRYFAEILISRGWVRREDYYQALAKVLRLDLFDPKRDKVELELISDELYEQYIAYKFLPISRSTNDTDCIETAQKREREKVPGCGGVDRGSKED